MTYSFHPEAQKELSEAVKYYEDIKTGLGLDFLKEVKMAIKRIKDFPKAWTPFSENTRRCLVNRFPYGVIYQVEDKEIKIIAIMHLSRKPLYYRNRIK